MSREGYQDGQWRSLPIEEMNAIPSSKVTRRDLLDPRNTVQFTDEEGKLLREALTGNIEEKEDQS